MMTNEQIKEYNILCAYFLDWKNKGMVNLEMWVSNKFPNGITTSELKFHSNWNWIMEVVEAIEQLGYLFEICGNGEKNFGCITKVNFGESLIRVGFNEVNLSKKETTVQTIFQFLKMNKL